MITKENAMSVKDIIFNKLEEQFKNGDILLFLARDSLGRFLITENVLVMSDCLQEEDIDDVIDMSTCFFKIGTIEDTSIVLKNNIKKLVTELCQILNKIEDRSNVMETEVFGYFYNINSTKNITMNDYIKELINEINEVKRISNY